MLLFILLLGILLRSVSLNPVFVSSDHVQWVYASLNIFSNRSLFDPHISNNLLAGIFGFPYGFGVITIIYLFALVFNFLNIPINEFSMSVPVIVTAITTILFVYLVTKELLNRKAALLAALLVAIEPFYVIESRDIGRMHIILALCLELMILYCFIRYLRTPSKKNAILSSLPLALYLGSSNMAFGIIPVIFFMAITLGTEKNDKFRDRFKKGCGLIFKKEILLLPIIVLIVYASAQIYSVLHLKSIYCGFWGKTLKETKVLGIYGVDLIRYFIQNCGYFLTALISFGFLYGLICFLRGKKIGIIFFWALLYTIPFLFFAPPHATVVRVYLLGPELGFEILGVAGLLFVLEKLYKTKTSPLLPIFFKIMILIFFLSVFFISICLIPGKGLPIAGRFSGVIKDMGNMQWRDLGIKTAGYYVRENGDSADKIFTDTELFQANYYLGKKVIYSSYDWLDINKMVKYFSLIKDKLDLIVIDKINEKYILPELSKNTDQFHKVAEIIAADNEVKTVIYSKKNTPPEKMNMYHYNYLFDQKYGRIKKLIPELTPWPQPDMPLPN